MAGGALADGASPSPGVLRRRLLDALMAAEREGAPDATPADATPAAVRSGRGSSFDAHNAPYQCHRHR